MDGDFLLFVHMVEGVNILPWSYGIKAIFPFLRTPTLGLNNHHQKFLPPSIWGENFDTRVCRDMHIQTMTWSHNYYCWHDTILILLTPSFIIRAGLRGVCAFHFSQVPTFRRSHVWISAFL
jgi:hypothetical protein